MDIIIFFKNIEIKNFYFKCFTEIFKLIKILNFCSPLLWGSSQKHNSILFIISGDSNGQIFVGHLLKFCIKKIGMKW